MITAKEYLLEIRRLKCRCLVLQMRCDELRTQAASVKAITYDRDRVQSSPRNQMEAIMIRLADLEDKYARTIAEYHAAIHIREKQIEGLQNPDYEEILRLRYIEDNKQGRQMSLEEIAVRMHRSYPRVKHMHGEALEAFRKQYLTRRKLSTQ